jgi:DNA-directed RNA polymerase specialized sigma24 family protein
MDRSLKQQLSEGKLSALKDAFESYFHGLYEMCRKKGVRGEDAEQLIQEVFLELWEKKGKPEKNVVIYDWLRQRLENLLAEEEQDKTQADMDSFYDKLNKEDQSLIAEHIWQQKKMSDPDKAIQLGQALIRLNELRKS